MTFAFENPILIKELRTRMRGAKAFWILFSFLSTLAMILSVAYYAWSYNADSSSTAFSVGRQFYAVLFAVQAALVGLITPALTAGALSIEREQRTYEALAVSRLSRRSLVLGKLFSALAFVALLLVGSLPLTSICFLLGGVSPGEVAGAYVLLAASAFLYGATGIAFSSFAKTTASSTVMTYGTILLFFFATLPLTLIGAPDFLGGHGAVGRACLVAVNPVGAMAAATTIERYFGVSVPAWLPALAVNLLLGTILTVVALHRLEYPKSDRSPLLRSLTGLAVGLIATLVFASLLGNNLLGIPRDSFLVAGFVLVALPMILVPLFATGEGLPTPRRFLALKRGEATSGFTFALGLTALCGGIALAISPSSSGSQILPISACLALASAFGFGGLGLWLSKMLNARWGALALTAAAMGVLYALPICGYDPSHPNALDALRFLSPLGELISRTTGPVSANWQATVALYALMGTVFLGLTLRRRHR